MMFHFIRKTLVHPTTNNGCSFRAQNSSMAASFSLMRYFSSDVDNTHSFTVSYLINSCGLSPKSALIASKHVHLKNTANPELILSFFENIGFSKPQISGMIRNFPNFLSFNPHKVIFPKVDFFRSKVACTTDLVPIFTVSPWIFRKSLENQLVPSFNSLVHLFESEYKAIELIKLNPRVLTSNVAADLIANINTLKEIGVPTSNISLLYRYNWQSTGNPVRFGEIVDEVKEMGFNPLKPPFVRAVAVLASLSKPTTDQKVKLYKKWGWSDKDITAAFKKNPQCMAYSEGKITATMDFYVNKLGLEFSVLAHCPTLLGYSLKKRLIPRGAVLQLMSSKGLVKLDSSITHFFICSESRFLEKYVNCHEEAPHLIKVYNEKLKLYDTTKSGNDEE